MVARDPAPARKGTVVAIHSTIRPETAEQLAADAAPEGVDVVDAPVERRVHGRRTKARSPSWPAVTAEAVDRCREAFGRWAELVVHFGPVGAGTRAKLARNLIHVRRLLGRGGSAAARRSGRARPRARSRRWSGTPTRSTGGPGAIMLRPTTAPMAADDPLHEILVHTASLGEKDLRLALELGRELGVDLPFAGWRWRDSRAASDWSPARELPRAPARPTRPVRRGSSCSPGI